MKTNGRTGDNFQAESNCDLCVKIVIVDDHAIVREGLTSFLNSEIGYEVVGTAENGRDAERVVHAQQPDVVILDISMADMNGIDALPSILRAAPHCQPIILSMHSSAEIIYRAFQAGARGYVLKNSATSEIVDAINSTLIGNTFLSKEISIYERRRSARPRPGMSPLESLSPRERQVLQLVAEGNSSASIAKMINISPKTVETYRSRIMQKIRVSNVAGLAKFAVEHGLTPSS